MLISTHPRGTKLAASTKFRSEDKLYLHGKAKTFSQRVEVCLTRHTAQEMRLSFSGTFLCWRSAS
jgi:hypothetical protein